MTPTRTQPPTSLWVSGATELAAASPPLWSPQPSNLDAAYAGCDPGKPASKNCCKNPGTSSMTRGGATPRAATVLAGGAGSPTMIPDVKGPGPGDTVVPGAKAGTKQTQGAAGMVPFAPAGKCMEQSAQPPLQPGSSLSVLLKEA